MKVTEHIANAEGNTLVSFEILPPLKGATMQSIFNILDPLMEYKPPFIDVTYHREEYLYKKREGGYLEKVSIRKRPGTVGICAAIINKYHVDTVPHIICGGFSREETENALIDLHFLGIDNVLALRGQHHAMIQFIADLLRDPFEGDEIKHVVIVIERPAHLDCHLIVVAMQPLAAVAFKGDEVPGTEGQMIFSDTNTIQARHDADPFSPRLFKPGGI